MIYVNARKTVEIHTIAESVLCDAYKSPTLLKIKKKIKFHYPLTSVAHGGGGGAFKNDVTRPKGREGYVKIVTRGGNRKSDVPNAFYCNGFQTMERKIYTYRVKKKYPPQCELHFSCCYDYSLL